MKYGDSSSLILTAENCNVTRKFPVKNMQSVVVDFIRFTSLLNRLFSYSANKFNGLFLFASVRTYSHKLHAPGIAAITSNLIKFEFVDRITISFVGSN